jgi:hypothetical protein
VATWLFLPYVFQSPYLAYYTWPRVPHVCASNFLALFYTTCLLMFNTGRSNYSSSTAYMLSCVAVSLPALPLPHKPLAVHFQQCSHA